MLRLHRKLWAALAWGGFSTWAGWTGLARAEEDGVVRISSRPPVVAQGRVQPANCNAYGAQNYGYSSGYGGYGGSCQTGSCQSGSCQHCGGGGCGHCGQHTHHLGNLLGYLDPNGPCMHSPDYGWQEPAKVRMWNRSVAYRKQFPDAWTGQQGATGSGPRPMQVGMPTDTTQLGYYYQQVPTWRPNPAMLPPVPQPGQYHRYPQGNGNCGQSGHQGGQLFGSSIEMAPTYGASPVYGGMEGSVDQGNVIYSTPQENTVRPSEPIHSAPSPVMESSPAPSFITPAPMLGNPTPLQVVPPQPTPVPFPEAPAAPPPEGKTARRPARDEMAHVPQIRPARR